MAVIAVTNHDTIAGMQETVEVFRTSSTRVIPGIEISCTFSGFHRDVHILGLGVDYQNPTLMKYSEDFDEASRKRSKKLIKKLIRNGCEVDNSILAKPGNLNILNIFRAIKSSPEFDVQNPTPEDFKKFVNQWGRRCSPHYVPMDKAKLSFQAAIELIHWAGGRAVLAHPGETFKKNPAQVLRVIDQMVECGLDGIEVFTPKHSKKEVEKFWHMAKHFAIFATAGSDFHGSGAGRSGLGEINTYGIHFNEKEVIAKILR